MTVETLAGLAVQERRQLQLRLPDDVSHLAQQVETSPHDAPARRYLGKIYGLMGLNHFYVGDRHAARTWTERALTECRRRQDSSGEEIYRANLKEIGRVDPNT